MQSSQWPDGQGVYAIRNRVNGRTYYGRGVFKQRFSQHLQSLRMNKHFNCELQADWFAYGETVFIFEIVEHVTAGERHSGSTEEVQYILRDPNCYNRDSYGYRARENGDYPIPNPSRFNGFWNKKSG